MPRLLLIIGLLAFSLSGQQPAQPSPSPEAVRLDSLIEELAALKTQAAALEARIDALLRGLSEQRGALLAVKPAYNALKTVAVENPPDAKPPQVRCASMTSAGKRCTRAAAEGSRYCTQHKLAHQK